MESQGFFDRSTSLALSLHSARKEESCPSSVSTQTSHVSPNEYLLNRQTELGIRSVPNLTLTACCEECATRLVACEVDVFGGGEAGLPVKE